MNDLDRETEMEISRTFARVLLAGLLGFAGLFTLVGTLVAIVAH
jgi:hypothetical protein